MTQRLADARATGMGTIDMARLHSGGLVGRPLKEAKAVQRM